MMDNAMDCQTCNDLLLDLAYGELDEVRAAAVRRHADGCAECRDALARITRGRSVAKRMTQEEPPDVSRTLRAAIDAQAARFAEASLAGAAVPAGAGGDPSMDAGSNVVPIRPKDGRVSRWFERAGELAMRRQVAMAAVFIIMIGVGLIFYQSHPRPTDAQDDRVADVVPAVEITPSNGTAPSTGTNRLPAPGLPVAHTVERDERARLATAAAMRERAQAPRANNNGSLEEAATLHDGLQTQAAAQHHGASAMRDLEMPSANSEAQSGQAYGSQPAQPSAPQPSPANAPAVARVTAQQGNTAGSTDTIARLQADLAAAGDEGTRARIRQQLIAEYERRGMIAEANTLRSQTIEPNVAASNSLNNVNAGATAQMPAAASDDSTAGSAASATRTTTSRRTMLRRPAAGRRAAPSVDSFDSAAGL